jgi:putative MATE family efflux protein
MRRRSLDARILRLALPAAASSLVLVVHRAVDLAWIRGLGTEAVASLTVGNVSVWIFYAVGSLVAIGLTALIARYVGAMRAEAAGYVAAQGLRWALAVGLAAAALGWFLAPLFFEAANATPGVIENGLAYTRIFWVGGTFLLVQLAGDAIFRGHGNTRTPMYIAMISLLLNVALDPLLIWGFGPIPALGVPGAAWATVLASIVAAALTLHALARRGHLQRARPPDEALRLEATTRLGRPAFAGLDPSIFLRMARVGTPTMTASVLFSVILLELLKVAQAAGGPAAQAGLGIGHTGEGIAYVMCLGWAAAASSFVGRHLGARQPGRAERAAWRAALQCGLLNLCWALVLFFFADGIARAFAEEAAAQAHAASYLRIVALCLVPQAYELVLDGAFGGAGMTIPPMIIGVTLAAARIPLAWWAAIDLGHGAVGIWWVICITALLRGLFVALWFARGTWKQRSV